MFEDDTILTLEVLDDPAGVEVIDQLERLRYQLWTAEPVSPRPVDPDTFHFPVSNAFEIATETLSVPTTVSICLRGEAGGMIADVGHLEEESVGEGKYIIELGAQIKTYVEVDGPIEITSDLLEKEIAFEQPRDARVGIRSRHERPAATVTTTEEPRDMMTAISTFGSALKSTSPERSYPTLRGHPPNIEVGDTLDVPAGVQPPETGVWIEIPETYEAIYTVAPLAYYLGAEVKPGTTPRLVTEDGFRYRLDTPEDLETGVARALKQLFTLDCVTRVDGLYNVDLHERNVIEERVDLDFASLYDQPLPEQVATYLSVPYSKLEDCIPTWRLTTHVQPRPASIEQLPYVINDLSLVRIANPPSAGEKPSDASKKQATTRSAGLTQSTAEPVMRATTDETDTGAENYVEPEPTDSLEQAWIGDGIPIGATKLTKQAFENWFDREKVDGDISITIIVNDSRMNEERDLVNEVYGDRDDLPFEVTVHNNLSVSELRTVLSQKHSFLHYIGHVEEGGFKCDDGMFDASNLESTDIDSFMLNACSSYRQGQNLINSGAVGGIVTLNDVINDEAVKIGETVAHLLNAGFPLDTSLSIAREHSVFGGQYIVVGAGELMVTQQPGMVPFLIDISSVGNKVKFTIVSYVNKAARLGTIFTPHIEKINDFYLASKPVRDITTTNEEFRDYIELQAVPTRMNEELHLDSNFVLDSLV
jgi:hypothetical protein